MTARDFAQTVELAQRGGARADRDRAPPRRPRSRPRRVGLASRSAALVRWARGRRFELALGHGSNDVTVAAAALRIPARRCSTTSGRRCSTTSTAGSRGAVVVPDAIPPARLRRYGAAGKIAAYPGLKEEYYLADFEPSHGGARRARSRPARADRRRAHAAVGLAVPPLRQRAVRRRARARARRPGGGAAARRGAARGAASRRAASSSRRTRSTRSR